MPQIVGSSNNQYIADRKEDLIKCEKGKLDESDRIQLRAYLETIDYLNAKIASFESMILRAADKTKVRILDSLPGVGMISAAQIVGELGDVNRFDKPSQVTSYSGMNSSVYQSAGKTFHGHIIQRKETDG